jgi:hypothetical protein
MPHRFLKGAKGVFARIISATSQSADADCKPETGLMALEDPFSGFPAIEDYGIIGDNLRCVAGPRKRGYWKIVALSAGKTVSSEQIDDTMCPKPTFCKHGFRPRAEWLFSRI